MLKAGLVGAGHLGKIHLRLLNQSDKYDFVGFHDKDVENGRKLEAEFGYKYFENFDELLDQIEMLDIVTPTLYHYDYAVKAIEKVAMYAAVFARGWRLKNRRCDGFLYKSRAWRRHTGLVKSYPQDCPVRAGISRCRCGLHCLKNRRRRGFLYESTTWRCHTRLVKTYPHDCPALAGITGAALAQIPFAAGVAQAATLTPFQNATRPRISSASGLGSA